MSKQTKPCRKRQRSPPLSDALIVSNEKLQEIGRKARLRLEEDRSNRKEIVRLDHDIIDIEHSKNNTTRISKNNTAISKSKSRFSQSVKQSTTKTRLRPVTRRKTSTKSAKKATLGDDNDETTKIDSWVPNVRHMTSYDLPKEERSNIVRLHGLPKGVQTDHIRSFFAGLSPQRIFVLPSLDLSIFDFDESLDVDSTKKSTHKPIVKRHPSSFRVFVKFQSYHIADAALQRLEEAIYVDENIRAAIAITPVRKHIATYIQNVMAIDGVKNKTIEEALRDTEHQVPKVVNELLWSMSKKELKLNVALQNIGGGSYPSIAHDSLHSIFPPCTKESLQKLITLYNNLLDMYEMLGKEVIQFKVQDVDPTMEVCPAHSLTKSVSNWILDQLEMIQKCLVSHSRFMNR
mmetsp:Transcript_28353/g.33021  ORF Transcript_28353/g.33021 Transcript_28353/m.33021 type:complete len:403 (+) Transcript_28353:126-1334(+)